MVSKGWTRAKAAFRRENRHQSKIYTESNQSHFSRIFGDLSLTQTLAIYRQLLAKDHQRTTGQERPVKT
jgi:hypothetical protein